MKKGQTPKSPAQKTSRLYIQIMSFLIAIINSVIGDPVNLQIFASIAFIVALLAVVGGSHG